jgi:leucyl/phenylalanyl-tRNA--protein transferase
VSSRIRPSIEPSPSRFRMPDPAKCEPGEDLIAVGADLQPGTLLAAYRAGLFPMPVDPGRRRTRIAWYSPDPRGIIPLDGLRVSRSLRRSERRYEVRLDTEFRAVMEACAARERPGHWITADFLDAYDELFALGWAHSVETYLAGELVGGLYGVRVGGLFAGESMFHRTTDSSKVALVRLVEWLRETGAELLDVQWATDHLVSLGAIEIPRATYLARLRSAVAARAPSDRTAAWVDGNEERSGPAPP